MIKEFKTKEEAKEALFNFYKAAFEDENVKEVSFYEIGIDKVLKFKRYDEDLYRVYCYKPRHGDSLKDIKYNIVFQFESKNGDVVFANSEETSYMQNCFNDFNND